MKPRTIACLSVRQPWASLIVHGIKPIENRSFFCKNRELFAIHAGKTWGDDEEIAYAQLFQIALEMRDERRQDILYRSRYMLGGFVGVARLRSCISEQEWFADGGREFDGKHQWFIGLVGWFFTGARAFSRLVSYKGQRGIFRVPFSHVVSAGQEGGGNGCAI